MGLSQAIAKGISNPQAGCKFFASIIVSLLRRDFDYALREVRKTLFGINRPIRDHIYKLYYKYFHGGLVKRKIHNYDMLLDVTDGWGGISWQLIKNGTREEQSYFVLRQLLKKLTIKVDDEIVVLEIGANIGYYALLEADVLGKRGRILAFEAEPNNVYLLRKNIALNGFEERISTEHCAIGDRTGSAELNISSRSNLHQISSTDIKKPNSFGSGKSKTEVPMKTIDDILSEKNLSPGDINVVRMDVEGFEHHVYSGGLDDILGADTPFVLFIEIHPVLLPKSAMLDLIDGLRRDGLKIISADLYKGGGEHVEAESLDQITEEGVENAELILTRNIY